VEGVTVTVGLAVGVLVEPVDVGLGVTPGGRVRVGVGVSVSDDAEDGVGEGGIPAKVGVAGPPTQTEIWADGCRELAPLSRETRFWMKGRSARRAGLNGMAGSEGLIRSSRIYPAWPGMTRARFTRITAKRTHFRSLSSLPRGLSGAAPAIDRSLASGDKRAVLEGRSPEGWPPARGYPKRPPLTICSIVRRPAL
jgi:hypothetical protein